MFKWNCLSVILFANSIFGLTVWAQSDKIFKQNQKLGIETHMEFSYNEAHPEDKISSFTSYNVDCSAGKRDTQFINQVWYDKHGRIIKETEIERDPGTGLANIHSRHYLNDKRGNVLSTIDSIAGSDYVWAMFLAQKEKAKDPEKIKEQKKLEQELIDRGINKSQKKAGERKQFIYDSLGYLIFYTNLNIGYKVVVEYKLDNKQRIIEWSSLDTTKRSGSSEHPKTIRKFEYDNDDHIIKIGRTVEYASGKKDRFAHESGIPSEVYFTYDTSGEYKTIISHNERRKDTLSYRYHYNNQKQRISTTKFYGKDTSSVTNYSYENGLLKKEFNNQYANRKTYQQQSKTLIEYQYYPNNEVKAVLNYEFWEEDGVVSKPTLRSIEFFEYTYH